MTVRQSRGASHLVGSSSPTRARAEPSLILLGENVDMARTLRALSLPVTVIGGPTTPARFSRRGFRWREDPRPDEGALLALLAKLSCGSALSVLFYDNDRDLLFVSRNRDRLGRIGLVMPPAELIEQLVDKAAFADLAQLLQLPVPPSWTLPTAGAWKPPPTPFPVLVKPTVRDGHWTAHADGQKAVLVHDAEELRTFVENLSGSYERVVVQTYIPGSETQVESYHVYVDMTGRIVAEFTGRKIRTRPAENGFSTALVTTDSADLREFGRSIVRVLGLTGVAKLDVKRGPDGRLWLLEVNARFNLWHRIGAAAGVDIPALVVADLCGRPRPPATGARAGVQWCHVPMDLLAAREAGLTVSQWTRWAMQCDARTGFDVLDPMPFVAGRVWPTLRAGLRRRTTTPSPDLVGAQIEAKG